MALNGAILENMAMGKVFKDNVGIGRLTSRPQGLTLWTFLVTENLQLPQVTTNPLTFIIVYQEGGTL